MGVHIINASMSPTLKKKTLYYVGGLLSIHNGAAKRQCSLAGILGKVNMHPLSYLRAFLDYRKPQNNFFVKGLANVALLLKRISLIAALPVFLSPSIHAFVLQL